MPLINKRKGISVHNKIMFLNATLTEIPIPTKKPQEIRTKNAHNNLARVGSANSGPGTHVTWALLLVIPFRCLPSNVLYSMY